MEVPPTSSDSFRPVSSGLFASSGTLGVFVVLSCACVCVCVRLGGGGGESRMTMPHNRISLPWLPSVGVQQEGCASRFITLPYCRITRGLPVCDVNSRRARPISRERVGGGSDVELCFKLELLALSGSLRLAFDSLKRWLHRHAEEVVPGTHRVVGERRPAQPSFGIVLLVSSRCSKNQIGSRVLALRWSILNLL